MGMDGAMGWMNVLWKQCGGFTHKKLQQTSNFELSTPAEVSKFKFAEKEGVLRLELSLT